MANSTVSIGERIRYFRQLRGITLKKLAETVGITSSMLSQIERDLANPSLNTLRTISAALDVPLFRIFMDDTPQSTNLVRPENRKHIIENGVEYELLTPDMNSTIEFCQLKLESGCSTIDSAMSHKGEEVALALKGTFSLSLDGVSYTLCEGDSILIPSLVKHVWTNIGKETAELVFAVTPPDF